MGGEREDDGERRDELEECYSYRENFRLEGLSGCHPLEVQLADCSVGQLQQEGWTHYGMVQSTSYEVR